jgi:glycosyltransferase involved in cell wall biosynthesis
MRVLTVSEDPDIVGGIPRYTVPVAEELVRRGHDVHYMWSGGYLGRYDWRLRRRWTTAERNGVAFHGLLNARAIGVHAGQPELDVDNADVGWLAARARRLAPDVIHVHSLLGVPVHSLTGLSRVAPVVLSCHDFGLICQRRVLVKGDGTACRSYASQAECAGCVGPSDPRLYRLRARLRNTPKGVGIRAAHALERVLGREVDVQGSPAASAGPAVDPRRAEAYRRRLSETVRTINADVRGVLAVSGAVRDHLLEVGVESGLVEVMHIGSGSADRIARLPLNVDRGGGPVTLLFLGGYIPIKGGRVFLEALGRLPSRYAVVFAGGGYEWFERELRSIAPEGVRFHGRYRREELDGLLASADVVVAPAIGPDTSPQVVLEAQAAGRPVVATAIGGAPDFVEDGVDGRVVAPDDVEALADALAALLDPAEVRRLAANVERPRSVQRHVDDLAEAYARHVG